MSTVFAYGATGAGKTYTMLGTPDCPGVTFSAVMALFSKIEDNKSEHIYDISVSYLEVTVRHVTFIIYSLYVDAICRKLSNCVCDLPYMLKFVYLLTYFAVLYLSVCLISSSVSLLRCSCHLEYLSGTRK